MKILIVSDGYPTEKHRMSGLFAFDQAKALVQAGHKVYFAAVNLRSIRRKRQWGYYKKTIDGVTIYNMSIPLGDVPQSVYNRAAVASLNYLMKKMKMDGVCIDIVHAHFYDMAYCAARLKDKYGYPLVVTEHYSGFLKEESKGFKKILPTVQYAYHRADRVLAVGVALKDSIKRNTGVSAMVIPNVVATEVFRNTGTIKSKENAVRQNGTIQFVTVGRLSPEKDMGLLIRSFAEAYQSNKNIRLKIIGDGGLRSQLEELITETKMTEIISIAGFLPRNKIAVEFNKADCFVLLSAWETFGVVYIEALAAGLPVIATRCGGPEGFMREEYGLLIEPNHEKQAVGAVLYMSSHFDEYDGEAISRQVCADFAPDTVAEELTKHYMEIMVKKT